MTVFVEIRNIFSKLIKYQHQISTYDLIMMIITRSFTTVRSARAREI